MIEINLISLWDQQSSFEFDFEFKWKCFFPLFVP